MQHSTHNNLSLLQHEYKENGKQQEQPSMFKVIQVQNNHQQQKLRDRQKALKQNESLHKDIYSTITNKLNNNVIRIDDFFKLLQEYEITINFETVDDIFRICDADRDYALNYVEYLSMIKNSKANKIYTTYSKIQVRKKIKRQKLLNVVIDEANNYKLRSVIPITLLGFFFHIAHMICRSDLYTFAQDKSNLAVERFEAMFNLLKYSQKNNCLQTNEDNYDEDLKRKIQQTTRQKNQIPLESPEQTQFNILDDSLVLNTTRLLRLENSLSQICNSKHIIETQELNSQRSQSHDPQKLSFMQFSGAKNPPPNVEDEIELLELVKSAQNLGQSVAQTEFYQSTLLAGPLDFTSQIHSPIRNKIGKKLILRLPVLPHTFGSNGTIKKQYKLPAFSQKLYSDDEDDNQFGKVELVTSHSMPITILQKMGLKMPMKQANNRDLSSHKDYSLKMPQRFQEIKKNFQISSRQESLEILEKQIISVPKSFGIQDNSYSEQFMAKGQQNAQVQSSFTLQQQSSLPLTKLQQKSDHQRSQTELPQKMKIINFVKFEPPTQIETETKRPLKQLSVPREQKKSIKTNLSIQKRHMFNDQQISQQEENIFVPKCFETNKNKHKKTDSYSQTIEIEQ